MVQYCNGTVDEIVIWDKFVINELTLLVDNRVQELSPFALAFRLVSALALVASAQLYLYTESTGRSSGTGHKALCPVPG